MIERHLPYFAMVAEEQHFQRAADRLGITQSALSRRIQALEHELGFKLFERTARGARLTPAGQSLDADVRRIRRDLARATDRARSVMRGELGSLNIAINPSAWSNPQAIRLLRSFREANPSIDLNLEVTYSEDQIVGLQSGGIDVGVLYKLRDSSTLHYETLSCDRLHLILPNNHPLARKEKLTVGDLDSVQFVWPRRSHSPRLADWLFGACHRAGFSPKISMEVQDVESVINIVAMGVGAGFAMEYLRDQLPDSVTMRDIAELSLEVQLYLGWRADTDSPIIARLLAALRGLDATALPADHRS